MYIDFVFKFLKRINLFFYTIKKRAQLKKLNYFYTPNIIHIHKEIRFLKMNMNQLFIKLPRDLQWEVLTEFVGTHSVRKGKLRRKLVLGYPFRMVIYKPLIQKVAFPYNLDSVHEIAFVKLPLGRKITCFQDGNKSSDVRYSFTRPHDSTMLYNYGTIVEIVYPHENSVALPPFEKHSYPSYEYTDKKKQKTLNKIR